MKIYKRIEPGSPCEPNIDKYGIEKRWNFIKQNIKLGNNNEMRILDVGCGYGFYSEKCSAYASEVIGIDIFKEHLHIAKRRKRDNTYLILNSAEHLAFKDDTFDAIICIEVLEHIPFDERAVIEFSRILKPGGVLIVTGPNKLLPFETHIVGLGRESISMGFVGVMRRFRFIPARLRGTIHIARDYTPWELKKLLTRNGFKVKQLDFLMPTFEHSMKDKDILRGIPFTAVQVFNFFEHNPLFKKIFGLTIIICCEKEQSKVDSKRMKFRNNKNIFICFTGIDGSGKTTLAKELVKMMNEKGIQYKYVYGRIEPFIVKLFNFIGGKILLRGKDMLDNYAEYSSTKSSAIERHSFLFVFYRHILWFEYFLQILFKVRLPFMLGKNIVCDRYVYDTVINDFSAGTNYSGFEIGGLIKKCFYVAPKPDLVFLIDLPEEIAFQRKDDTPSIEYLKERRKVYLDVAKEEERMVILDGSLPLNNLKHILKDWIEKKV